MAKLKAFCVLMVFGGVSSLLTPVLGQEKARDRFGIFESRQEYNQFMGGLKQLGDPEIDRMIPAINDMVLGQPIGQTANQYGIGNRDGLMSLLTRDGVRQEIDMVDSQYEKLREVNREIQNNIAKEFLEIDLSDGDGVLKSIQQINKDARGRLESVLSPAQLKRLRQLALQNVLRKTTLGELLTTDPLASELGLDSQERKKLKEDADKIEKELNKQIEELRKKARRKLIGKLSKKRQSKLESLLGESFQFFEKKVKWKKRKRKKTSKSPGETK